MWIAFALPVIAAGAVLVQRWPDSSSTSTSKPVDVAAHGPQYSTVDELVAASDTIVLGSVERVSDGRVFTDPADPNAGIRTQLAELSVEQVLKGPVAHALVLEEEARLLDGTPITVDGTAPSTAGERGVYFLIADKQGSSNYALVGPQGRYLVEGDALLTSAHDSLSASLAARGFKGLIALL
jgi:hypothetical protein